MQETDVISAVILLLDHVWSYMRKFLEKPLRIRPIINTIVYKYMKELTYTKKIDITGGTQKYTVGSKKAVYKTVFK